MWLFKTAKIRNTSNSNLKIGLICKISSENQELKGLSKTGLIWVKIGINH
tara:strand:- start:2221 stop:2370 length:150 start_codon:yes stop_codon:yes gene_type:complete